MRPPFIATHDIQRRLQALGQRIDEDYADKTIDLICVPNGASMFCADLMRQIKRPTCLHYLGFSSYPSPNRSGEVRITLDIAEPMQGRDLLLVEGIIVSGRTPKYIMDMLRLRQPASLCLCALGIKRQALAVELPVQYSAFEFKSEIVVGYGVGEGAEKALPYLAIR